MKKTTFAALAALLLLAPACRKNFFEPEPANNPEAVFEALWQTFRNGYGPFGERSVDWQAVYAQYRPTVTAQTSDDQLFEVLSSALGRLDDGHVNLYTPDRPAFNSNRIRNQRIDNELFDLDVVCKKYLTNGFDTDDDTTFVFGLLPENIIYLHLPHIGGNMRQLGRAVDKFPDAKGLIVDLRHNDGGDFTWAFSEMGRLTAERRFVFRSRTKNGTGAADFTPWHDWHLEPKTPNYTRPIVLLTDRYTISAGERAVMAFQTLPNCTTLGDTTCGAHSTMVAGELANGWKYSIATQNTLLHDGKSYEGIGLAPDIFLKNSLSELKAGRDRVLEAAVERLK